MGMWGCGSEGGLGWSCVLYPPIHFHTRTDVISWQQDVYGEQPSSADGKTN